MKPQAEIVPSASTIIYKAAQILSAELVEGDYLEFGVFNGSSFIKAFKTVKQVYEERYTEYIDAAGLYSAEYKAEVNRIWNNMRFFAFDSFQGLPSLNDLDNESKIFSKGKFSFSLEDFKINLENNSVDMNKVEIVPGWFEETCCQETIDRRDMKHASIVYVDCDLYESAKTVLNFIEPLMVDGTVLIFDDWYCFRGNPNLGEQCAFREWSQVLDNWTFTEYQKEGAWRNSFIANKKI